MAKKSDDWTAKIQEIGWNCVAPIADSDFAAMPGTAMKAGQEVIYSKVLRKMMKFDRKSWMELVMFSLVTSTTDVGAGAWYGKPPSYKDLDLMGVVKEAVRPIVSVLLVNYIFNVSYIGFHNPMKSFSFMDFIIALAAKDLAVGGTAILKQKGPKTLGEKIDNLDALQRRQHLAARFAAKPASVIKIE